MPREIRTKDSFTKIWVGYDNNKTNVKKKKKKKRNETTAATTYSQDLQARRKT